MHTVSINRVVAGAVLVFLTIIARSSSAVSVRKLGKSKGFLLTGPENDTVHLGLCSKAVSRENMCGKGFCFHWGQGWGLGFLGLTIVSQ